MKQTSQSVEERLPDRASADLLSSPVPGVVDAPLEANDPLRPMRASWFRRIGHILGVDRAISFTLLARGWSSVSGLITLKLIAKHLTLDEQGYYYTFGSLVALQIVFELGFSSVLLQLASHEAAHLTISASGEITGDPTSHRRLASVLQRSLRWYGVASIAMACTVIPIGIHFFSNSVGNYAGPPIAWLYPWCAVVLAAVFTFQIDPLFSFLEGCGFVSQVAHSRFWQALVGSLLAWTALLSGHGLFAPALLILGQALAGMGWLVSKAKLLRGLLRVRSGTDRITLTEVWPFQWRIAISWLSGYFISQLFNPVLLHYWGPAAAGQMGMSITLSNAVSTIALAWVYTKAAPFGQMIARKNYGELDRVFFRAALQSFVLCALGSCVLWCGDVYLHTHHSAYAKRLLNPLPFGLLLCVPMLNQIVSSQALYLRAHKQEKFMFNSVLGAICISVSTLMLGKRYGALGITAGNLVIGIFVGVGLGTYTFVKYRRLWHNA